MPDMITKVAQSAAAEYERLAPLFIAGEIEARSVWTAIAKASIAAMREPSPEMQVRMHQVHLGGGEPADIYQAAIDAAAGEASYQVPMWPRVVSGA